MKSTKDWLCMQCLVALLVFVSALFILEMIFPHTPTEDSQQEVVDLAGSRSENEKTDEQVEIDINDSLFRAEYADVACVVAAECQTEPYDGKLMVCSAILNGSKHNGLDVHSQLTHWSYAKPIKVELVNDEVWSAVAEVIAQDRPINEEVLFWYSTANGFTSAWHESKYYLFTIGNHRFFTLKEVISK